MAKYKLKGLKVFENQEILQEIRHSDYFFTAPFSGLAKHYLSYFLDNIFQLSFKEILNFYLTEKNIDPIKIPNDEQGFYLYINNKYLQIDKEPSIAILNFYSNAANDLKEINENINYCKSVIKTLEVKKKEEKLEDHEYEIRLHNYYLDLNINGKEQIIDFISTDKIKDFAIYDCFPKRGISWLLYNRVPYDFSLLRSRFHPDSLSDLSNKFLKMYIEDHNDLCIQYKKKDAKFPEISKKYIEEHKLIESINNSINSNHRLVLRKPVFDEVFIAYSNENYNIFSSVVVLQIEGIFFDYCLELGLAEASIRNATLGDKISEIQKRNSEFSEFEYYMFRFPIIRNKIAHGKLIDDPEYLSDYLIHDLYNVCSLITSTNLLINKAVQLIKLGYENNNYKALVRYALYRDVIIPPFYDLKKEIIHLNKRFNEKEFFDFLKLIITQKNEILNIGIYKIAISLKKTGIHEKLCTDIIKEIGKINDLKYSHTEFLEELNRIEI